MKTIKLKCRCGAEFSYEDTKDDFSGNERFKYTVEAVASHWLEGHCQCYEGMDKETFALQIKEAWNQGFNAAMKEPRPSMRDKPKGTL